MADGIFSGAVFSPETWLGLQRDYDLRVIRKRDGAQIIRSVRTRPAA